MGKKTKKTIIFVFLFLFIFNCGKKTLLGQERVEGLSQREALERFGPPSRVSQRYWYYQQDESFYVYFSQIPREENIFIFPYRYDLVVGELFEIKAFLSYADLRVEEVTSQVEWNISNALVARKDNHFIPRREGKTYIYASYQGKESNITTVKIKSRPQEPEGQTVFSRPTLLPIHPVVAQYDNLEFSAWQTFCQDNNCFVENIATDEKTSWHISKAQRRQQENNLFSFFYPGKFEVYCEYEQLKSNVQIVQVKDKYHYPAGIKNITIVPSFANFRVGQKIEMRGFATYHNNQVREITRDLNWRVVNPHFAQFDQNRKNQLNLKRAGLAEVEARLGPGLLASAQLRIIEEKDPEIVEREHFEPDPEPEPKDAESVIEDIKDKTRDLSEEPVGLVSLEVSPAEFVLSLGEKKAIKAEAVYSNNYKRDISGLASWESLNNQVALVANEEVVSQSQGATKVKAIFQGIESDLISVEVGPPQLVSLALDKYGIGKNVNETFQVKTTGYYADESQKDLTASVQWNITDSKIIEEKGNGMFLTLREGQTYLSSRYDQVESLPLYVDVFVPFWVKVRNFFFYLGAFILAIITLFYLQIKAKVTALKKMQTSHPREFIKLLYDHFRKVMETFGLRRDHTKPPLVYANLAKEKFKTESNYFFDLGLKFSQAAYSSEEINPANAQFFQKQYNQSLLAVKSKSKKVFSKLVGLFLSRSPFTI